MESTIQNPWTTEPPIGHILEAVTSPKTFLKDAEDAAKRTTITD
jgi:hypothetical protein